MHIFCTICSDILNQIDNVYATKCGHMFHHQCLTQWTERSATCPQCRARVSERALVRLFPTAADSGAEDAAALQARLDEAALQAREHRALQADLKEDLQRTHQKLQHNMEVLKATEKKLASKEAAVSALREQMQYLRVQGEETTKLREENNNLKKNMQMLTALQKVLNATTAEVEEMLQGYTDVRTIATFATALKRALCESESKRNEQRLKLQKTAAALAAARAHPPAASPPSPSSPRRGVKRRASPPPSPPPPSPSSPRAHSPYLQLRRGSAALALLHPTAPTLKPSEFALLQGRAGAGRENRPTDRTDRPDRQGTALALRAQPPNRRRGLAPPKPLHSILRPN